MDILKKSLAPITNEAWDEINYQAKKVFNSILSARRFVDVEGPKGWGFQAVPLGRLEVPPNQKGVKYGINKILPLVEARSSFNLDIWELDNATRGAEDIDLTNMEDAARKIGEFEENVIYNGFSKADIKGLKNAREHKPVKYPENIEDLPEVISELISSFLKTSVEGPYSLILDTERWEKLSRLVDGYPIRKAIINLIEGKIILAPSIKDAYFISERGGDFRLTLGHDLAVGYESHDTKEVQLYFTESFTFQILEPAAIIKFS